MSGRKDRSDCCATARGGRGIGASAIAATARRKVKTGTAIDTLAHAGQFKSVKRSKPNRERKSKGTLIVQEHRPRMNKLTDAERQELMKAGYQLIYGGQRQPKLAD